MLKTRPSQFQQDERKIHLHRHLISKYKKGIRVNLADRVYLLTFTSSHHGRRRNELLQGTQ